MQLFAWRCKYNMIRSTPPGSLFNTSLCDTRHSKGFKWWKHLLSGAAYCRNCVCVFVYFLPKKCWFSGNFNQKSAFERGHKCKMNKTHSVSLEILSLHHAYLFTCNLQVIQRYSSSAAAVARCHWWALNLSKGAATSQTYKKNAENYKQRTQN